jgi:glutathione S-transferase
MKLYCFPASPNTWKVRAVAAHLGLPLETAMIDISKGEQHSPDYLALNPTGRTPTLVDGDFVLWESTAIMQYLASQKPNTLYPDDARSRADITRWQSWSLQHWGAGACNPLTFENFVKRLVGLGPPDNVAVARATEEFHREAKILDDHLATRKWLVGNDVTLADFSVAAGLIYAGEAQMPLAPYRNVQDWFARVFALPAWKETAPSQATAAA